MYRVTLHYDHDPEDPCKWGGWKVYSFNRRHASFRNPSEFYDEHGNLRIGFRTKLRHGLAFPLSYYEHGLCHWSIAGTRSYPDARWDSVSHAGFIVWEDKPEHLPSDDRAGDASSFLEIYTDWCNGNYFGCEIEKPETCPHCSHTEWEYVDSCWGFPGSCPENIADHLNSVLDGKPWFPADELTSTHLSGLIPNEATKEALT